MDETMELGPIDYILVEWPGRQPNGEAAPHLVDLVDRGLIRILDIAFVTTGEPLVGLEVVLGVGLDGAGRADVERHWAVLLVPWLRNQKP